MNELMAFEDEVNEEKEMGSRNHSFVQAKIPALLFNDERFSVFVELSLDTSQIDLKPFGLKAKEELKPDVCVYPKSVGFNDDDDDLKMQDMPPLAVEIVSPKQNLSDILSKFKAYFALGIKSCWLIVPPIKTIAVYSKPNHFRTFGMDTSEIIDEIMDIRLPIQKIFG